MTNQDQNLKPKFDLEERTAKFGEDIIKFCKATYTNRINGNIFSQLIRSATSIGANYCEADGADSKRDFHSKISICKKEAKETKYWLRMVTVCNPELREQCRIFWKEAQELTLIFSSINRKQRI